MKPDSAQSGTNIAYFVEHNGKGRKFKIGDRVGVSKNIKMFFRRATLQVGLRKSLESRK